MNADGARLDGKEGVDTRHGECLCENSSCVRNISIAVFVVCTRLASNVASSLITAQRTPMRDSAQHARTHTFYVSDEANVALHVTLARELYHASVVLHLL
jgi:hypothetical protein